MTLVLISTIPYAVAQDEEANDGIAQIVLITAKDGHAKALEEAITAYHHYVADKEGAFRWQWYSILTGPETGKYVARTGGHNWGDLDATHDWDDEVGDKFASDVQPHIASAEVIIRRTKDDVGIWPDSLDDYPYFSVTTWHIKQDQGKAFNDGLKKIDAALKEGGFPVYYTFSSAVSGGKGEQVNLVIPRKSFADMAPKEPSFDDIMNKAMGEEGAAAFLAEWSQTYYTGQNRLIKYRPKLSDYGDGGGDWHPIYKRSYKPRCKCRGFFGTENLDPNCCGFPISWPWALVNSLKVKP